MYSLFVPSQVGNRGSGLFEIPRNRFLEYTADLIRVQLQSLSVEAKDCIISWPCILMYEGRGQEEAHVVQIKAIDITKSDIKVMLTTLPTSSKILNDFLWKTREQLDFEQFEFSRNHWAIKDRDLFSVLAAAGYKFDKNLVSQFQFKPLPAPTRAEILKAKNIISEWSHTDIDDLLLEAGQFGLDAGRGMGSRRDRTNKIIEFTLNNPTATTAENSLLSAYIIKKALATVERSQHQEIGEILPEQADPHEESETRSPNRVFVVHGQNDVLRENIVSFLSSVGLEGIVLHDQPNMGRHLLTKFIEEAELVTFAIVLMTDDDVGSLKGASLEPRARQNVILELGYFLSHLGQQRVCALITPSLETPSDFDGIVYIRMSSDGRWKEELKRELKAAKMPLVETIEEAV